MVPQRHQAHYGYVLWKVWFSWRVCFPKLKNCTCLSIASIINSLICLFSRRHYAQEKLSTEHCPPVGREEVILKGNVQSGFAHGFCSTMRGPQIWKLPKFDFSCFASFCTQTLVHIRLKPLRTINVGDMETVCPMLKNITVQNVDKAFVYITTGHHL